MNLKLTPELFEKFLALLAADRDEAGRQYEALRGRLLKFFEWRNCEQAEELTDTVFDRILKKISEGEEIQKVPAFAVTVAQFVFKEYLRRNERQNQLIEDAPEVQNIPAPESNENETDTRRQDCFEKCLAKFGDDDRRFIIAYYETDEKTMIAARQRLAEKMNVSLNTIRIKACRLKAKLEKCVFDCCD